MGGAQTGGWINTGGDAGKVEGLGGGITGSATSSGGIMADRRVLGAL